MSSALKINEKKTTSWSYFTSSFIGYIVYILHINNLLKLLGPTICSKKGRIKNKSFRAKQGGSHLYQEVEVGESWFKASMGIKLVRLPSHISQPPS
jgi:hypothetical protein